MPKTKRRVVVGKKRVKNPTRTASAAREIGLLGRALRNLGGLGGSAIGGMMGMPMAGSAAGSSLGAAVSKWLGAGDYSVGSNTIVTSSLKGSNGIPDMHRNDQSVVIRHKEYLGEVRSNTTFTVNQSFELNPGISTTFPWLARIATRFQEYRIRGMVFHYVPSSGSAIASTNNALGTVMLQTSYRSNDTVPSSKVEMLNEYWSSEAVPSEAFCHPIECDPAENPFNIQYVRSTAVPSGDNKLLYDLGVTHVATSGQQASNIVLGDLWVSYEVELKKPLIDSNVTDDAVSVVASYPSPTGSTWFPGTPTTIGNLLYTTDGVRTISFPKGSVGSWLLSYRFTSANQDITTGLVGGPPTFANCAAYFAVDPFLGTSFTGTQAAGTVNQATAWVAVTITDPAVVAAVTFGAGTITGGTSLRGILTISRLA